MNHRYPQPVPAPPNARVERLGSGRFRFFPQQNPIDGPLHGPALRDSLRVAARDLGISAIGFASADAFVEARAALRRWLEVGHAGTMHYLFDQGDRADPRRLLEPAASLVSVAVALEPPSSDAQQKLPLFGQIARYATTEDYHRTLRLRLQELGQLVADRVGRPVLGRICVDTAPLLEREAARRSGLGFVAKSTMLIVPGIGPQVLLGTLLVDVDLGEESPRAPRCGRCTACLDICPTKALVGPYWLDARRCIAYLTIEYRGWIDRELRGQMGTFVFGCDLCQAVCPFDRSSTPATPSATSTRGTSVDLGAWLWLTASDYRRLARSSPIGRATREQLARNAAVALGNTGEPGAIPILAQALLRHRSPMVRGHSAWALGRFSLPEATEALERALNCEADPRVLEEIQAALQAKEAEPVQGRASG